MLIRSEMGDFSMGKNLSSRRRRKRGNIIRTTLAVLFFMIGIGLLLLDPIKNYMIKRGQEVNAIHQLTREQIEANEQRSVTYNFEDVGTLNPYTVISKNVDPKDLPTVGAIAIPSVKMNLPIYKGVSDEGMYLGAGTLLADQKMGESNYPLASHHSIHKELLFAPLINVNIGDFVYLTDLAKVYKYEIFYYEQVPATRIDLIEPTQEAIVTLITCDSSLVERIVVQGKLVESTPIEKANKEMVEAFKLKLTRPDQQ
ncbi:class A sortase [Aerococcaceae bacterium NML201209]|nr:class A sortase [Aerococcaceae bacterium NML201209]MCW6664697.1 class A sortase [Aerococcaceae bacterium NML191219]